MSDSTLGELLAQAEADLHAASGGAPLCRVSATGTTGQSVKYFEGRWAALRELARGRDPHEASEAWRLEYDRHIAQGSGQNWVHYSAGGVDAIADFLSDKPALP